MCSAGKVFLDILQGSTRIDQPQNLPNAIVDKLLFQEVVCGWPPSYWPVGYWLTDYWPTLTNKNIRVPLQNDLKAQLDQPQGQAVISGLTVISHWWDED